MKQVISHSSKLFIGSEYKFTSLPSPTRPYELISGKSSTHSPFPILLPHSGLKLTTLIPAPGPLHLLFPSYLPLDWHLVIIQAPAQSSGMPSLTTLSKQMPVTHMKYCLIVILYFLVYLFV